ncbi:class I SAM-dependent methyltransferase [bacterium]|nr:class I SAM-dependent methyltransferase [bacterium]
MITRRSFCRNSEGKKESSRLMTLEEVRNQYENYPYPYRNPEDEKKRLRPTMMGSLPRLSSLCYGGKNIIKKGFRVLDAGCGTGDATVFLAQQLKDVGGKVVAVDFSKESLYVAKKRCEIRDLKNVEFINGSLLDLSEMKIGMFDYIICSGVLHHLKNPSDGLNALKSVLKENSFISIMVYARYGRTALYMTQKLMRLINQNEKNVQSKIDNTKVILANYHKRHWNQLNLLKDDEKMGDIGLYDMYLHSQDRAYTIRGLFDWITSSSLNIFHIFQEYQYDIRFMLDNKDFLASISKLPKLERLAIGELFFGQINKHSIVVSKNKQEKIDYLEQDYSLYSPTLLLNIDPKHLKKSPKITVPLANNFIIHLNSFNRSILKNMDGIKSIRELLNIAKNNSGLGEEEGVEIFKDLVRMLQALDYIIFRKIEGPIK